MIRKALLSVCIPIVFLSFIPQAIAENPTSPLLVLKPFSGKWIGRGKGTDGPSVHKRVIHFMLNQSHMFCKCTVRYKPRKGEEVGRKTTSFGIFSFDPDKKVILYRKFISDGRVILYHLRKTDKNTLILQSNGKDSGEESRLVFQLADRNLLNITRFQGSDNKKFKQIEVIRLRRVTEKKKNHFRRNNNMNFL